MLCKLCVSILLFSISRDLFIKSGMLYPRLRFAYQGELYLSECQSLLACYESECCVCITMEIVVNMQAVDYA